MSAQYGLSVHDPRLVALSSRGTSAPDGSDESFFGDMVVDLVPNAPQRIPSVGPGAKILHARAGIGNADVPVRFFHDGADNWFVVGETNARVRLVTELAIPRAAFGGVFGDPGWSDLPKAPSLPPSVARAAAQVAVHIGVSRGLSPREAVAKLVAYFRGFVDSDEFPTDRDDVFLALALSKKGVCRHRSFAFLVTALGLGLPARMVANEAHAWVEVNDGTIWRRIDLGGAGRALDASLTEGVKHSPPPDPFAWPPNATRGDELADRARGATSSPGSSGGGGTKSGAELRRLRVRQGDRPRERRPRDLRSSRRSPRLARRARRGDADARRGSPLRVRGEVVADGAACGHLLVEIGLRDARGRDLPLGALATDDDGKYGGALVVPGFAPLGDYDLYARTSGDARCGRGGGP